MEFGGALGLAGGAVALFLGLLAAATAVTIGVRKGDADRADRRAETLEAEISDEIRRHTQTKLNLAETRAELDDCKTINLQQAERMSALEEKIDGYERVLAGLEGPLVELQRKIDEHDTQLARHDRKVTNADRRIIALMVDLLRGLGDRRSATAILAETEDRDL